MGTLQFFAPQPIPKGSDPYVKNFAESGSFYIPTVFHPRGVLRATPGVVMEERGNFNVRWWICGKV